MLEAPISVALGIIVMAVESAARDRGNLNNALSVIEGQVMVIRTMVSEINALEKNVKLAR